MKFTIQKRPLVETLAHVSIAVSTKTTIPILTGIKIAINDTRCTLTASDSDISIKADIPMPG